MLDLTPFERLVRAASLYTQERVTVSQFTHAFDERNIHSDLPPKVRKLFDDAHYAQATFEAAKFVDKKVGKFAQSSKSGSALMQEVFKDANPSIKLTPMSSPSEVDEQRGYQWIFTGSVWAIRNPRGHEFDVQDDMDRCLDHLCFFSMLMRRLEEAGYRFT